MARIVLVNRKNKRVIDNIDELETALRRHAAWQVTGPVYLEDLAVEDQIRLMASARVVVQPHGAGLFWTLAMHPGTAVVEVRPFGLKVNDYEVISKWARVRYFQWDVPESGATSSNPHDQRMRVDVDRIVQLVRSGFSNTRQDV